MQIIRYSRQAVSILLDVILRLSYSMKAKPGNKAKIAGKDVVNVTTNTPI